MLTLVLYLMENTPGAARMSTATVCLLRTLTVATNWPGATWTTCQPRGAPPAVRACLICWMLAGWPEPVSAGWLSKFAMASTFLAWAFSANRDRASATRRRMRVSMFSSSCVAPVTGPGRAPRHRLNWGDLLGSLPTASAGNRRPVLVVPSCGKVSHSCVPAVAELRHAYGRDVRPGNLWTDGAGPGRAAQRCDHPRPDAARVAGAHRRRPLGRPDPRRHGQPAGRRVRPRPGLP